MMTEEMIEGTREVTIEEVTGETTNIMEDDQESVLARGRGIGIGVERRREAGEIGTIEGDLLTTFRKDEWHMYISLSFPAILGPSGNLSEYVNR